MISFVDDEQGTGLDLVTATETFFSESGLLSKAKNFEFRPEQQQMAVAVARALKGNEHLIVEVRDDEAVSLPRDGEQDRFFIEVGSVGQNDKRIE